MQKHQADSQPAEFVRIDEHLAVCGGAAIPKNNEIKKWKFSFFYKK